MIYCTIGIVLKNVNKAFNKICFAIVKQIWEKKKVIGIDLGATNIRAAIVESGGPGEIVSKRINKTGTRQQVLDDVYEIADK